MARTKTTLVSKVEELLTEAGNEAAAHYQNAVAKQQEIDILTAEKQDEERKSQQASSLADGLTKLLKG